MVTQNILRAYEGELVISKKKTALWLFSSYRNGSNRSNNKRLLLTCAPISELPSNISTTAPPVLLTVKHLTRSEGFLDKNFQTISCCFAFFSKKKINYIHNLIRVKKLLISNVSFLLYTLFLLQHIREKRLFFNLYKNSVLD